MRLIIDASAAVNQGAGIGRYARMLVPSMARQLEGSDVTALVAPDANADPAVEQALLVQQVTGRVRWRESVLAMQAAGVTQFIELGGKVLGPMIRKIAEDVVVTSVVTMEDIENLAKELG